MVKNAQSLGAGRGEVRQRFFRTGIICLIVLVAIILFASTPAYSMFTGEVNDGGIGQAAVNMIKAGVITIRKVALPLGGLMIVACAIGTLTSSNPQKSANYWSWLKRIVIGLVIILGIELVMSGIQAFINIGTGTPAE